MSQGKAVVMLQCCRAQSRGDVSTALLSAWVAHAAGTETFPFVPAARLWVLFSFEITLCTYAFIVAASV